MFRPGFRPLILMLLMAGAAPAAASPPADGQEAAMAPPDQAGGATVPALDPVAATEAYLAKVPAEKKQRSDAYFEGGYWLILWNFLYASAVFWFLLATGASAAMRVRAERLSRFGWLKAGLYWTQFIVVWTVLQFPLTIYEGFFTLEADLFGLNATRQTDGAAEVALKFGEYRKLAPGPLEEIVFYDHPSGHSRIFMAMRFKAENPPAAN